MREVHTFLVAFIASACLCGAGIAAQGQDQKSTSGGKQAKAELRSAKNEAVGRATLTETPNGVIVAVTLNKAATGEHAFHIHTVGRCEPPAFESAGGHFNPGGAKHGFAATGGPHAGDLPNVHIPSGGTLSFEFFASGLTLEGGSNALLDTDGAALVMHAKPDDYTSDPSGAAGDRIACGVVQK